MHRRQLTVYCCPVKITVTGRNPSNMTPPPRYQSPSVPDDTPDAAPIVQGHRRASWRGVIQKLARFIHKL